MAIIWQKDDNEHVKAVKYVTEDWLDASSIGILLPTVQHPPVGESSEYGTYFDVLKTFYCKDN